MADDAERSAGQGSAKSGHDRDRDTIIHNRLRDGTLKLYELEKELSPIDAIRVRREFIQEETGTTLENVGILSIDVDRVVKRNCENMIGVIQVPLGVAPAPAPVVGSQ